MKYTKITRSEYIKIRETEIKINDRYSRDRIGKILATIRLAPGFKAQLIGIMRLFNKLNSQ